MIPKGVPLSLPKPLWDQFPVRLCSCACLLITVYVHIHVCFVLTLFTCAGRPPSSVTRYLYIYIDSTQTDRQTYNLRTHNERQRQYAFTVCMFGLTRMCVCAYLRARAALI